MPPGDLITEDYQFEFNGLLLGDQTDFDVREITGLLDMPEIREGDVTRPFDHGQFVGPHWLARRIVEIKLDIVGESSSDLALNQILFEQAFKLGGETDADLVFQLPTLGKRLLHCRTLRRATPVTLRYAINYPEATVQLVAIDPRMYSSTLYSTTDVTGESSGGHGFPIDFPHGFGFATGLGSGDINNAGNLPAPWSAVITGGSGGCSNPKLTHIESDRFIQWQGSLDEDESLVIDSLTKTLTIGGQSVYGSIVPGSAWFELYPGDNNVQFNCTGAGDYALSWRDAWA